MSEFILARIIGTILLFAAVMPACCFWESTKDFVDSLRLGGWNRDCDILSLFGMLFFCLVSVVLIIGGIGVWTCVRY